MHREYVNLLKERVRLEAKNSVLKEAYEHLLERVPTSLTEHVVLKREAYPNITYWYRHEYQSALAEDKITSVDDAPIKAPGAERNEVDDDDDDVNGEDDSALPEQTSGAPKGKRGKGRASQGQNVKMRYIQHENGEIIDGWRASDIRRFARSIFVGFALQGKVFHSWVEGVDAASRTSYYRDMVARFPEIGLCELDWKAEQIGSEIYSQWRSNWMNKQEAEKSKATGLSKRPVDEGSKDLSRKKIKPSKSRSESVSLDLPPADFSDVVPQINVIPVLTENLKEQIAAGSQIPAAAIDVGFSLLGARPEYQFSVNKPFAVKQSSFPAPSFLATVEPIHPAHGSSNLDQHHLNAQPMQASNNLPHETSQKASKRPNKMRANKHSVTPRNLCAKEWVEQYHGTVEEFAAYFLSLPTEELERFKALSKSLSSEKDA
ncbi:hypothetical protein HYPSUDRAFT_200771 [Hypholoma sublateritium FD-334 SS-4]|uniref:Uncharacterized protein n=1 Tax=Hypholoma sublateritium (strain FD-334 SS-4) TaxID=945553 RepID=A0A0D2MKM8_HYPSF|nr:hypothetical protein HYPSUDRAFT_200771 [Hypholoma sublateritium FD-334 SS-4]